MKISTGQERSEQNRMTKKKMTLISRFCWGQNLGPVFLESYWLLSARWSQNLHFEAPSNQLLAKGRRAFGLPLTNRKIAANSSAARYWQINKLPTLLGNQQSFGQLLILKGKAISYQNKMRDLCILFQILSFPLLWSIHLNSVWG